jgi:NifU-like protein involved in Fe-S cluster formation
VMRLQIMVDENGTVVDAKFKTFGCGSAIAASSLATEKLRGLRFDELEKFSGNVNEIISAELSLPPVKWHCSVLAKEAIQAAVADYKAKNAVSSENAEGDTMVGVAGDAAAAA